MKPERVHPGVSHLFHTPSCKLYKAALRKMCLRCMVGRRQPVETGGGDGGLPHCCDRQRGGGAGAAGGVRSGPGGSWVRSVLDVKGGQGGGGGEGLGAEGGAGLQVERLVLQ